MARYAEGTTVSPEKTMVEIRRVLLKYEASGVVIGEYGSEIAVQFIMRERHIRFRLRMPIPADFSHDKRGWKRSTTATQNAYKQAVRQAWRGLLLVIKAKLESIESEIESFEEAFMAQLVLGDGRTMAEVVLPQISTGQLALLPAG